MRNRFKGLDLIECLMNYGRRFMTLYRRPESRPSPRKRNAKKQNGCWGGLTNSCEKKGSEKQRYKHLNAEFQRIARRDKWLCMHVRVSIKTVEYWRIDAFELWCWRRLLRVPGTTRRSNQSILKETSPGCSLEDWFWSWNSNTLATSCKKLTHWKRPWCWEGLGAGGEGDDRGQDGWMASPTRWTWVWVKSGSRWWTGRPGMLRFMGSQRVRHDWATELNWNKEKFFPSKT